MTTVDVRAEKEGPERDGGGNVSGRLHVLGASGAVFPPVSLHTSTKWWF